MIISVSYTHLDVYKRQGESRITGALKSDDTKYMAQALRQLGVLVDETGETEFLIKSDGNLKPSENELFLGNAGTAVRLSLIHI